MKSINWKSIGFKENPFGMVPDKNSKDLIWAGFKDNKSKFDEILVSSLKEQASQLILVLSRYGGGKTHSSYFYSQQKNLPETDFEFTLPINLVVNTPKEGNNASEEFYIKLLESIKISRISDTIKTLRRHYSDDKEALHTLQVKSNSEDLGRILWLLGHDDDDISFLAEQAVFGNNLSNSDKLKLRVRRGINSNSDKAQLLSCIFSILSSFDEQKKLDRGRRIFLWIDELESLIFYTSKQYRPFTQTIREIIDFCPKYLTLFMNFSFAEPEDASNVEIVIGEALLDRVNNQIIIQEATDEDSLIYLKELFKHYRVEGFSKSDFYPFKESALRSLFAKGTQETGKPLMPRTINKWCLFMINTINNKKDLSKINEIDDSMVEEVSLESSLF